MSSLARSASTAASLSKACKKGSIRSLYLSFEAKAGYATVPRAVLSASSRRDTSRSACGLSCETCARSTRPCLGTLRQPPQTRPDIYGSNRISPASRSYGTTPVVEGPKEPVIHHQFDPVTGTWQYVVADPATSTAVIIDPVLDYDKTDRSLVTENADALMALVQEKGYRIDWILETHAHADHLTAASYLRHRLAEVQGHKPKIGIGKRIEKVQNLFGERYGVASEELFNVYDTLFEDDETFHIGELTAVAMHLPGHTPDHLGYKIGDNLFCGDSIFHADIGTARCDFPGGSASDLFASTRKMLALPGHVKIWAGHDYPPTDREPVPWLSVSEHKRTNKHVRDGLSEAEFVALREERDAALGAPRLLHESLQVNIRAGKLPRETLGGQRLLHLPLHKPKVPGLTDDSK